MAQGGGQGTLGLQRLTPVGNVKAELVSWLHSRKSINTFKSYLSVFSGEDKPTLLLQIQMTLLRPASR